MVKRNVKKLMALALSILMVTGLFTEWLPTVMAVGEPPAAAQEDVTPEVPVLDSSDAVASTLADPPAKQIDFQDPDNGRPNLYVDFLGDNMYYLPKDPANPAVPQLANPGGLVAPSTYDMSKESNPDPNQDDYNDPINPHNLWEGYRLDHVTTYADKPIFWVGVGVDRTQVWELLGKSNQGLTSLEVGFYYNKEFIEPYTGGDYAATLTAANIGTGRNKWSDQYAIIHAETDLPVDADLVTLEKMKNPSIEAIMNNTYTDDGIVVPGNSRPDWRMTYVSLELKATPSSIVNTQRRLDGVYQVDYDTDGRQVIPPSAKGTDGPEYLLMIPFQLKEYDSNKQLCLRLIRDATHFSVGAGSDGAEEYAAWERTTLRNEGKSLKLQLRFTGDLNIFRGTKASIKTNQEPYYNAQLRFLSGGGAENTARLSVRGDPSITPVWVDQDTQYIDYLQGGTGMQVDVTVQSGYTATIRVVYLDGVDPVTNEPIEVPWTYNVITDQEQYTFVMPEYNTIVYVSIQGGDSSNLYLTEIPRPGDVAAGYRLGNETTVTDGTVSVNSFDPVQKHPKDGHADGPKQKFTSNKCVMVTVNTHADSQAVVHIYNFRSAKNITGSITFTGTGAFMDANGDGFITLPYGGEISFIMPESDVDVVVEYLPGEAHTALLQVWHDNAAEDDIVADPALGERNIAQFAYTVYDDNNVASTDYSGQVYEVVTDDAVNGRIRKNSEVRDPSYKTPWVPRSQAALSGSLGGDTGRTGKAWTFPATDPADLVKGPAAIMSELGEASNEAYFTNRFNALDLASAVLYTESGVPFKGLRKDLNGLPFGDGDLLMAASFLWELRTKIKGDSTLSSLYDVTVPVSSTDSTKAYSYIDLTPAQVQAYIIDALEIDEVRLTNEAAYRAAYQRYKGLLKTWEDVVAVETTQGATAPIHPLKPQDAAVDSSTGARTYQGTDYETAYIAQFNRYMDLYQDYIENVVSPVISFDDYLDGWITAATASPAGTVLTQRSDGLPVALPNVDTVSISPATGTDSAEDKVKAAAAKYGWTNNQLTAPPARTASITTREGRRVNVLLEADSGYDVASVVVKDKSGNLLFTVAANPSYQNVYSFDMPSEDCVVEVHYDIRERRDMDWIVKDAEIPENHVHIEAYQVSTPGAVVPTLATADSVYSVNPDTGTIKDVLVKSTVVLDVSCHDDYDVTVSATNGPGGTSILVTGSLSTGYRFIVPEDNGAGNVVVTVTYTKKGVDNHTAHLVLTDFDGNYSMDNVAIWPASNATVITTAEGTALHGEISLAPGYYIYSSYTVVADPTYPEHASGPWPYTLSGNGYNNGLGCLGANPGDRPPVAVETTMPNNDLWVYIVVRRGLPDPEQVNTLTIIAIDEDNTDKTNIADNWIKTTVYKRENTALTRVTLPTVGLGTTGGGTNLTSYTGDTNLNESILAGDEVVLDLSAAHDAGFYVAGVEIGPSYLGTSMQWIEADLTANPGARKLRFTMPAGSATVTVRFAKREATFPTYRIYARKLEIDRNNVQVVTSGNRITSAYSTTIRNFAGGAYSIPATASNPAQVPDVTYGTGAGLAGEKVTMTFVVAPGWYVQSTVVLTDGSVRDVPFTIVAGSGDNRGAGGTFTADVVLPAGDAWFTVNYRQCPQDPSGTGILPEPEVPEYAMLLRLIDDDNTNTPKDSNSVTAAFSSAVSSHLGLHAPITVNQNDITAVQYIHAGDVVDLTSQLASGYTVDYVLVGPPSAGIQAGYREPGHACFTMPAENVTVIVKVIKDERHPYTANLTLRPPAGMSTSDMGEVGWGTFATVNGTAVGSLDDYPDNAIYSQLLRAGDLVDLELFAFDGYYIDRITVDPPEGSSCSLTGAFGFQSGSFVMPQCDVNINVWFKKGWPDEVRYDLTLEVFDASKRPGNYGYFHSLNGTIFTGSASDLVHGSESKTLTSRVLDGQEVVVGLNRESGFFYDSTSIFVTDSAGNAIDWRFVGDGIAFLMPPRATTVSVTFLREKDEAPRKQRVARLYLIGNDDGAAVVNLRNEAGTSISYNNSALTGLKVDEKLSLKVDLNLTGYKRVVKTVYAVDSGTGRQLLVPIGAEVDGYAVTNAYLRVPDGSDTDEIKVYVILEDMDATQAPPAMKLVVSGPAGSGRAKLELDEDPDNNYIYVIAGDTAVSQAANAIRAERTKTMTLTLEPNIPGYELTELKIIDGHGDPVPYSWISLLQDPDFQPTRWFQDEGWDVNPKRQISLAMPPDGGTIRVTYTPMTAEQQNHKYRAQVVVNDSQFAGTKNDPRNDAKLWTDWQRSDTAPFNYLLDADNNKIPDLQTIITAQPGQWVNLKITVQAGYRIVPIVVVPQSFGIKPQLYLGDLDSQTTGFVMPAGDVTVYVAFIRDGLQVFNATLVVEGETGPMEADGIGIDRASITSLRSGTEGPIDANCFPVAVQAAPQREWVTVDYTWDDAKYYPKSVTVQDWAGRNVPFTQVDPHQITLPMVSKDIVITVTYADRTTDPPPTPGPLPPDGPYPDPEPLGCPVVLHVIDASTGQDITADTDGWARLYYSVAADTGIVTALPIQPNESDDTWGNLAAILAPAGQMVQLTAYSDFANLVYIDSAYVLYREGGQMIWCNLTPNHVDTAYTAMGFYDTRSDAFEVHLGRNDVYVFLNRYNNTDNPPPTTDRYTATLMLKGLTGDIGSTAAISVGEDIKNADRKAVVRVNGSHGKVIAERGETIKITVTPVDGYDIDYILVTPLGVPIAPIKVNKTYTFTMPRFNVSVCVYLKRSTAKEYTATVHYAQYWNPANTMPGDNNANIVWAPLDEANPRVAKANLATPTQSIQVTEGETVTLNVTLDAPYTVLAAYILQNGHMVALNPNLEGTVENLSMINNDLADGTASFTMPGGDVDVYVVTTDDPPTGDDWYTAVLTVQDPDDSGLNRATFFRNDTAAFAPLPNPWTMDVDSALPNHGFITVRQGQTVTVQVQAAAPGYYFDWPATITHSAAYGETLHPRASASNVYVYEFTMGSCNSAVLANFKKEETKKSDLTVVIEDEDNPGYTGAAQENNDVTVSISTTGTPALNLSSTGPNGAYQVIREVEEGAIATITATAFAGYEAYAQFFDGDTTELIPLIHTGSSYTGSVKMPGKDAQITVTFYKTWSATLILEDRNTADQSTQAEMWADFPMHMGFGATATTVNQRFGPVLVNQVGANWGTIDKLGRNTVLTVKVNVEEISKLTAIMVTDSTGTSFLDLNSYTTAADGGLLYNYTMDRSDVTITVVIDRKESGPSGKPGFVAAVRTVNRPAGIPDSQYVLSVNPVPSPARSGNIWISADAGAAVTLTVPIPNNYSATAEWYAVGDPGTVHPLPLTPNPTPAQTSTGTLTMPNPGDNVLITVTYTAVPTLSFRVVLPAEIASAVTGAHVDTVDPTSAAVTLAPGGILSSRVEAGKTVTVTVTDPAAITPAIPIPGSSPAADYTILLKNAYYQTSGGTPQGLSLTAAAFSDTFAMPARDTVVTLIYDFDHAAIPGTPYTPWYTAWVEVLDDDGQPENVVSGITNISHPGTYPDSSPNWAGGAAGDEMWLTFNVKLGYTAVVTARTTGGTAIPVIQQGSTGSCTASARIPSGASASDIIITVRYIAPGVTPPPALTDHQEITLVLVGHDGRSGNAARTLGVDKAEVMNSTGGFVSYAGTVLTTNGEYGYHLDSNDITTPVYTNREVEDTTKTQAQAKAGDELRLSADWTTGYRVVKATLSVPKDDSYVITNADLEDPAENDNFMTTELNLSRYSSNASVRFNVPSGRAVVTVYYENIYTVTLNVVGTVNGTYGDTIDTTDDRPTTVTSVTGAQVIHKTGDQLLELSGKGETVITKALPGPTSPNQLIGVVYESALTGARATSNLPVGSDFYEFPMPMDNVMLYTFFEPTPDPTDPNAPKRSYIAKVARDESGEPLGNGNTLEIKNTTDTAASHGLYWTGAREGETVEITIGLRKGYQAIVTATWMDDLNPPKAIGDFDFYVSRTTVVVSGKTTTFSMPVLPSGDGTDATVFVKFIKGYDFTLEMMDATDVGGNKVKTEIFDNADPNASPVVLMGSSAPVTPPAAVAPSVSTTANTWGEELPPWTGATTGTVYTATMDLTNGGSLRNRVDLHPDGSSVKCHSDQDKVEGLTGGEPMVLDVSVDAGYLLTLSVSDGTNQVMLTPVIGNSRYTFTMPASDVTVSAVFAVIPRYSAKVTLVNPTDLCGVRLSEEDSTNAVEALDFATHILPNTVEKGRKVWLQVVAEEGYDVTVTATPDGSATGTVLTATRVTPSGMYYEYTMNNDVEFTVDYSKKTWSPAGTLAPFYIANAVLVGDDGKAGNFATVHPAGYPDVGKAATPPSGTCSGIPVGTAMVVRVRAEAGYTVASVLVDTATPGGTPTNAIPDVNVEGRYTFAMPGDDAVITVTYAPAPTSPGVGQSATLFAETVTEVTEGSAPAVTPAAPAAGDDDLRPEIPPAIEEDGVVSLMAAAVTDSSHTSGVPSGLPVATNAESTFTDIQKWVMWYTPFTGTRTVYKGENVPTVWETTAAEDTLVSVLFRSDTDADDLMAKVEVQGESDINGNSADPIEDKGPTALTVRQNKVWTTTTGGNTIDLTLTVAKGYVAEIMVLRDDSTVDPVTGYPTDPSKWKYLDGERYAFNLNGDVYPAGTTRITARFKTGTPGVSPFPGSVSDPQHFTFTMPTTAAEVGTPGTPGYIPADEATDVTVIVNFIYAGDLPAPYDPRNDAAMTPSFLEEGFIYAESRGDCAIVEIPTLYDEADFYNTDEYDSRKITFHFFIKDLASGTATELVQGRDIILEPYDPAALLNYDDPLTTSVDETDPYNYIPGLNNMARGTPYTPSGSVTLAPGEYMGSRFVLKLTEQTVASTAQYFALRDILDSNGSLDAAHNNTTVLYVRAEDTVNNGHSALTEVWVRPCISIGARVISYAPKHTMDAELYTLIDPGPAITGPALDAYMLDINNYEAVPSFTDTLDPVVWGSDRWQQVVRVRSSELLGGYDKNYDPATPLGSETPTFALVLKKASNLTYTRVALQLNTTMANSSNYYNAATHTYAIQGDPIELVAGDIDGDGQVKWQDQDMLMNYLYRNGKWSRRLAAPAVVEKPAATVPATDPAWTAYNAYLAELADWEISVYNPDSVPYHCDLNGDETLSVADWNVLVAQGNYNHVVDDYRWNESGTLVLPHGLGDVPMGGTAVLLSVVWEEGPAAPDPLWDTPLTDEEMAALGGEPYDPAHPPVVDSPALPAPGDDDLRPETPVLDDDLRPEIPVMDDDADLVRPGAGNDGGDEDSRPVDPSAGQEEPIPEAPAPGDPAWDEENPVLLPAPGWEEDWGEEAP